MTEKLEDLDGVCSLAFASAAGPAGRAPEFTGWGGPQGVHSSPTSLPPTEPRFLFSALMAHDILKGTNKRIAVPSF